MNALRAWPPVMPFASEAGLALGSQRCLIRGEHLDVERSDRIRG
jgi:hypothetical protein